MRSILAALFVVVTAITPSARAIPYPAQVATASGQLAILNGLGTMDLQAVAPTRLSDARPAGIAAFVLQSTFEPPGPHVVVATLRCATVFRGPLGDDQLFAYGDATGDPRLHEIWIHIAPNGTLGLWNVGWSFERPLSWIDDSCAGVLQATVPLIGAAAIVPQDLD